MGHELASVLTRRALREMADARSFGRGEEYFDSGQVGALTEHKGTLAAKVFGTHEYRVKLWVEDDELGYDCTCPVGVDGACCKHCVAVGLAWLAECAGDKKPNKEREPKIMLPKVTLKDVEAYLERQEKPALVEMIMERVMKDDRLRERVLMKAARMGSKGLDLATFRQAISHAVGAGGFVKYGEMRDYARGIGEVIGSVADLLKEGYAAEVIELAEYALKQVESVLGSVDDSNGHMGGLQHRLLELHRAACQMAKPDPKALAEWLFDWEMRGAYETFSGAAKIYAEVLGQKGLARYRQLAEEEWARVPVLAPGQDDPHRYDSRFRITQMMESLAQESGDIEALVAIKSRDLAHAYAYLQIAEVYKKARRYDQALEWAERGVKAFPNRTDARLREFLAEEYHRRKRHAAAMALIWAAFAESPYLQNYQKLKTHADHLKQWPPWREKALAFMHQTLSKAKPNAPQVPWGWSARLDYSELVQVFLWEGDAEAAWREANAGGCSNDLWLELAASREQQHPEDALPIYQRQIEPAINQKNNRAYQQAAEYLRRVGKLMKRLGREAEFARYFESIRAAHKPKRNFTKLLDQIKW